MNDSIDMLCEAIRLLIWKEENDDVIVGLSKALGIARTSRLDNSWRDEWHELLSDEEKYLILEEYI